MIEQYLIHLIKNRKLQNLCLESDETRSKWIFSCYIGKAYAKRSQEVWEEGESPFEVLENAIKFISRYMRGCKVGNRKESKWDSIRKQDKKLKGSELSCQNKETNINSPHYGNNQESL